MPLPHCRALPRPRGPETPAHALGCHAQVTNSRAHPIRYSLDVFVHKNSRVRAEGPSSVERQLLLPGEERLLVFVVALSQDAEKAREDLQGLGYTVAWVPA